MGPNPLSVVLCSNRLLLNTPDEMEQVLVHELVHVFDVLKLRLDLRECDNLAYSEVRAAREAECRHAWFSTHSCIQNKATVATNNLFPGPKGRACVSNVFDKAVRDRRPFPTPQQRSFQGEEQGPSQR